MGSCREWAGHFSGESYRMSQLLKLFGRKSFVFTFLSQKVDITHQVSRYSENISCTFWDKIPYLPLTEHVQDDKFVQRRKGFSFSMKAQLPFVGYAMKLAGNRTEEFFNIQMLRIGRHCRLDLLFWWWLWLIAPITC